MKGMSEVLGMGRNCGPYLRSASDGLF